ncbi:signal peptidase I [Candidatus Woesearchaeota archaeon]|nr:MAG: signal peptidase I [Candidatus Woesearchaeota archaeon]
MEHPGTFDEWWQSPASCNKEMCTQADFYANYNITREQFESFRFKNGFNMGDIMVLHGVKPKDVQQGDVIVFKSNRPDPIIHRVIKTQEINGVYHFTTKGDHNKNIHPGIAESDIREDRLIGKALIRVPLLGWIKIGFMRLVQMLGVVLK